ncbi:MAG TPA: hypothetical protein PK397_05315 [Ignavibacteriaceae bacterium]|nr:hypothetical protein [Ignavibacteriaceae bacterium]
MNIASIDIGTNTILFLIVEVDFILKKIVKHLYSDYKIPRIGEGILLSNQIKETKITELIATLTEFKKLAADYNCDVIIAGGTNPFRIAQNKEHVIDVVLKQTGITIKTLTPYDEGRLGYLGAVSGFVSKSEKTIVIDIGGSSTELSIGNGTNFEFSKSYQVGAVTLSEIYLKNNRIEHLQAKELNSFFSHILADLTIHFSEFDQVIALAGTPITLYSLINKITEIDETIIEGNTLSSIQINEMTEHLLTLSVDEILKSYSPLIKGREDVIQTGAMLLSFIINQLNANEIIVSTKGIRYGLILDYLSTISDTCSE